MSHAQTHHPIVALTREVYGTLDIPGAELRCAGAEKITREKLLALVPGAHVLITMYTDRVDDAVLDAAGPQLRGVINFAVGYDNIDVSACARRGVTVCNTPHAVTEGTADLAWSLILAVARGIPRLDSYARSPEYAARGHLGMGERVGMDLAGRTLLIVGAGRIGYATALRSLGWGMRVLYTARSRHLEFEMAPLNAARVTLEDGVRQADVVSVHTPLTPETRHLISADILGAMKPSAILINTSRGPVVDESALAATLKRASIFGAGLDVFEREPIVHPDLLALDNVVLTPHVGSASIKSRTLMAEMVSQSAKALIAGATPPFVVK
ncbi:MAG: D-glycerate dehydrogenase [Planctomycetota bacterium]|nr:D-glycerate dehydrogenase [Planctomycetota bacterium]